MLTAKTLIRLDGRPGWSQSSLGAHAILLVLSCHGSNNSRRKDYSKNPKYSDTRKICCNHPKIQTRLFYRRVMHPKDADGMANSEDPDQTARRNGKQWRPWSDCSCSSMSSLIWVYTVCLDLPVRKLRIIMVIVRYFIFMRPYQGIAVMFSCSPN